MATINKTHSVKVANLTRKTNSKLFAFFGLSCLHAFEVVLLFAYHLAIARVMNAERRFPEVKNVERRS